MGQNASHSPVLHNINHGQTMSSRAVAFTVGLMFVQFALHTAFATEPAPASTQDGGAWKGQPWLRIGEMTEAAGDLRKAAESLGRLGKALGEFAQSLATMSSEFDPFGYKTAFRTMGQQTQIIQQQSEVIRELQEREIERLQRENKVLKMQLKKLSSPSRRKPSANQR